MLCEPNQLNMIEDTFRLATNNAKSKLVQVNFYRYLWWLILRTCQGRFSNFGSESPKANLYEVSVQLNYRFRRSIILKAFPLFNLVTYFVIRSRSF